MSWIRREEISRRIKPSSREITLPPESIYDHEGELLEKPINFRLLSRLLSYLKPHWKSVALNVLVVLLMTVLGDLLRVHVFRNVVNQARLKQVNVVAWWIVIFLLSQALVGLLHVLYERSVTRLCQTVIHDLRTAMFNHLQRLSLSYFDRTKQGRIISRATSDVSVLEELYSNAIPSLIGSLIRIVGVAGYMAWLNFQLFLTVLWIPPTLAVIVWVFQPWVMRAQREMRLRVSRLTSNLAENVQGVRVIQAFNREHVNLRRFDELGRLYFDSRMRAMLRFNFFFGIMGLIGALGTATIFLRIWLVGLGNLNPGDLVAFVLAVGMFFEPIRHLADLYNQSLTAMAGGERVFELLDTQPEVKDLPDAVTLPAVRGHVRFEDVSFSYVPGVPVLENINLEVKPGKTVAFVGPTGAGKSSVINLLCRFYDPQVGRVTVDGYDVKHVTLQSLHSQMGIVLQDAFLFSGTVMDNIRFGRPQAGDAECIEAARSIGAHEVIANLRDGYQTQVSERGESLSAGERQLICFTRAMVANPRILILDEATSAVDSQTEYRVQQALERLVERRTSFVVAHRLSTVRNADEVLVVEDGRIVERGAHASLLAAGGHYARMYKEFLRSGAVAPTQDKSVDRPGRIGKLDEQ